MHDDGSGAVMPNITVVMRVCLLSHLHFTALRKFIVGSALSDVWLQYA